MKKNSKNIVQSRLFGGLGNQLFIYAFSKAMALRNNADLELDIKSGFLNDKKFKRVFELTKLDLDFVELKPISKVKRKLLRYVNFFLPFKMKFCHYEDTSNFNDLFLHKKIKGKIYFEGYWQNYHYFEDQKKAIKSELYDSLQKLIIDHESYKLVQDKNCVAIHVRFFDIDEPTSSTIMTTCYYKEAVARISKSVQKPYFLIFSDNINRAKKLILPILNNNNFIFMDFSQLSLVDEFALMCSCNHFIISNSTFSWWGAWLGSSIHKQIYAPNIFVPKENGGTWNVEELIPEGWILIDVKPNEK
ncbi:alpha-1,2-fucosyltransferase [Alphaproteobacteria bacterium]|nr:alpha-1,2-fucosyltransferase [Alphaproteobacteria bacterium]